MNTYLVTHASGASEEVEADFFQRDGDDWVFFLGQEEVERTSHLDVLAIVKA